MGTHMERETATRVMIIAMDTLTIRSGMQRRVTITATMVTAIMAIVMITMQRVRMDILHTFYLRA